MKFKKTLAYIIATNPFLSKFQVFEGKSKQAKQVLTFLQRVERDKKQLYYSLLFSSLLMLPLSFRSLDKQQHYLHNLQSLAVCTVNCRYQWNQILIVLGLDIYIIYIIYLLFSFLLFFIFFYFFSGIGNLEPNHQEFQELGLDLTQWSSPTLI